MIGNIELLELDLSRNLGHENRINKLKAAVERASSLTSRLLAFSRQQPLLPRALNISILFDDINDLLLRTVDESITLAVSVAPDIWWIKVEVDYNTDAWFARPTREIIHSIARSAEDSYMYVFTRNLRDPTQRSPHAMELRYVFNTLPSDAPPADLEIAQLLNDYWTQFAKNGTPNGDGLPQWPAYDLESQVHQVLGVRVGQDSMLRKQELDELDRYFSDRYNSAINK